jgi:quercetin dioxygenase-like cupin family protein
VLLRPGEGEAISERLMIKVGRPELVLSELNRAKGEPGTNAHIHKEHSDCFYILDGDLQVLLGEETITAEPGDFVLVPPNVVHGFQKETEGRTRFLNIHAPGAAFDDYVRASRDGDKERAARFDSYDPPADGGRDPADAIVLKSGEGEQVPMGPFNLVFKTGDHGELAFFESTVGPGFPGPPPHYHEGFVDSFWVLEGELNLRLGDDRVTAGPGSYAYLPPGTVHTFSTGDQPVRMLNLMAPGGFEGYLKEVSASLQPGQVPSPEDLAKIASKYDFHVAG